MQQNKKSTEKSDKRTIKNNLPRQVYLNELTNCCSAVICNEYARICGCWRELKTSGVSSSRCFTSACGFASTLTKLHTQSDDDVNSDWNVYSECRRDLGTGLVRRGAWEGPLGREDVGDWDGLFSWGTKYQGEGHIDSTKCRRDQADSHFWEPGRGMCAEDMEASFLMGN